MALSKRGWHSKMVPSKSINKAAIFPFGAHKLRPGVWHREGMLHRFCDKSHVNGIRSADPAFFCEKLLTANATVHKVGSDREDEGENSERKREDQKVQPCVADQESSHSTKHSAACDEIAGHLAHG